MLILVQRVVLIDLVVIHTLMAQFQFQPVLRLTWFGVCDRFKASRKRVNVLSHEVLNLIVDFVRAMTRPSPGACLIMNVISRHEI